MISLTNELDVLRSLAEGVRAQRIDAGWRQIDLAARSGVPLPTLRKFETTGLIGTAALARLLVSLGAADKFQDAVKPVAREPQSLDEFIKTATAPRVRQRVRQSIKS
jgi:transcriptional regulator with XRE-family HTH domain